MEKTKEIKKTKAIQKIEEKGSALELYGKKLVVTKENIQEVNEKIKYCSDSMKKINLFMAKYVDKPYAKYKVGFDIRKDMLSDFVNFKNVAGLKTSAYETQLAKEKAEAERIAEVKRLKDEADLKQKALDEAKVLEDAGMTEKAEEIKEEAKMIFVPVKTIEKSSAKVKGISYTDFTEIEIQDQKKFLKNALLLHDTFEGCIEINIPKLRKIIETNKLETFPGLKIEEIKKQRG